MTVRQISSYSMNETVNPFNHKRVSGNPSLASAKLAMSYRDNQIRHHSPIKFCTRGLARPSETLAIQISHFVSHYSYQSQAEILLGASQQPYTFPSTNCTSHIYQA